MAVEFKQLPCEHCKPDCKGMDLHVESVRIKFNDGSVHNVTNTLYCRNEELCQYFREQLLEHERS